MNGEQTMEDKIEYKSKTGHFWIGLRNGSDFPLNRNGGTHRPLERRPAPDRRRRIPSG